MQIRLHHGWVVATQRALLALVGALTLLSASTRAQQTVATPGVPFDPEKQIASIGFDQHLGQQLPLDTLVRTEDGRVVPLREFFGSRPVVLAFVYFSCPSLCTEVLNGAVASMKATSLELGQDYDFLALSIDPSESDELTLAKKQRYLENFGRPEQSHGWHFLRADQPGIDALTRAAGFRYVFYPETGEYAHASGLAVTTPSGVLSRYLFGVEYANKDLRLAVVEASEGKVGDLADWILMLCFHYDPTAGKYGFAIVRFLRFFGIAFVLATAIFIVHSLRSERRALRPAGSSS